MFICSFETYHMLAEYWNDVVYLFILCIPHVERISDIWGTFAHFKHTICWQNIRQMGYICSFYHTRCWKNIRHMGTFVHFIIPNAERILDRWVYLFILNIPNVERILDRWGTCVSFKHNKRMTEYWQDLVYFVTFEHTTCWPNIRKIVIVYIVSLLNVSHVDWILENRVHFVPFKYTTCLPNIREMVYIFSLFNMPHFGWILEQSCTFRPFYTYHMMTEY